jgi:hypothetical protein
VIPSDVRDGIKTAINITGLRVYDTIPDGLVPPALVIGQLSLTWEYVLANTLDTATIDLILITGRMSERSAQDYLDSFLAPTGSTSIKAKLDAAPTLPKASVATVSTSRVVSATPISVSVSGVEMLAYRYSMELYG